MILSHCTHPTVFHVALNMRPIDREEIYGLRWEENPFIVTNEVMACSRFAWVAWWNEKPAAVFGGFETHPGAWRMFMFGTDDFPRLALGLTRFCIKTGLPALFNDLKARRLEADSHENHHEAHNWLELVGARREGTRQQFGRDGADYYTYVVVRGVDFCLVPG